MPWLRISSLLSNKGTPMAIPAFFASSVREMMQPSLLLSTTTGFLFKWGLNNLSQEQ
jgi:hypothetical protein